ncbi:MAG: TMEM165/GDT1 family protein [Acidimicrobiales bacterium]
MTFAAVLAEALRAFAAVFPAELPDKTMVASIVLVARYRRPLAVWCGAALAFAVHVVVAVTAGRLVSLLPAAAVKAGVVVLFSVGAVVLWRSSDDGPEASDDATTQPTTAKAAVAGSFGVILLAEWGDLTQLATASLAATSDAPVAVGVGALLALWAVAGIAVTAGRQLLRRVPLAVIHRVAAGVFAALALIALVELVRG